MAKENKKRSRDYPSREYPSKDRGDSNRDFRDRDYPTKDSKDSKATKDSKNIEDITDVKDIKDSKDSKDGNDEEQPNKKAKVDRSDIINVAPAVDGSIYTPLSIRNNFASFSQSLASLLSPGVSQDALIDAIGEEQANMLAALREMKNEGQLPWLPKAKLVPIVPISEATPDNDGKKYPPPLPIIIDDDLRTSVFTHRSAIPGEDDSKAGTEKRHYERLEFLGDAYLQSITSHILYSRFQTIREGSLSEMRQNLVSNKPLAKYAELYDMHKKIRSGGSLQVTKDNMTKIVADCFEAYLGAVILDHDDRYVGIKVVTEWLEKLFEPKIWEMENLRNREIPLNKMAKQELNVIAVCGGPRGTKLTYKWTSGGGGNNGGFWITVYLDGWGWVQRELGKGWALKKLDAELRAAMNVLMDKELIKEITQKKESLIGTRPTKSAPKTTAPAPESRDYQTKQDLEIKLEY